MVVAVVATIGAVVVAIGVEEVIIETPGEHFCSRHHHPGQMKDTTARFKRA